MNILYIATNFTAITHTFITREVNEIQKAGHQVSLLSVRTHLDQEGVVNAECDLSRSSRIYPVHFPQLITGLSRALLKTPGRFFRALKMIVSSKEDSLKTRLKLTYQLIVATHLAKEVERQRYDHLHAHFASPPTTFALFLHLLTDVPFSFTGHAADIFRESSALKAKLSHADAVVAISQYNHDYYNTIIPGLETARVHCGIDPNSFDFRHRSAPNSPLRILSVGRSVPKKGFRYLLEALSLLNEAGVNWVCDIAGGGPLQNELESLAKDLNLDGLTLHGPMQQESIRKLIMDADVFVLPCVVTPDGDRDNIPVSLIEAMAAGCPVISTTVAGIPELIGGNGEFGLTVEQGNSESIATSLQSLISDHDLYASLSRSGRTQIEENFNIHRSGEQLVRIFEKSVSKTERTNSIRNVSVN